MASSTADADVKRKFTQRIHLTLGAHKELLLAIHNKKSEASLETMLVEQFVLLLNVSWEAFINDLIVAYVTLDPSVCVRSLELRITQSVRERFGREAERAITVCFPNELSTRKAAALLDPKKWNIAFDSAQSLAVRANSLLAAVHAKKFSFDVNDSEFIDLTIGLRNYLSHRSSGSREILKRKIADVNGSANQPLRTSSLKDVGSYLKAKDSNNDSRAVLIAKRFRGIATRL